MKKIAFLIIISVFLVSCEKKVCVKSHIETEPAYRYDCGPSMWFDGKFKMACWYRNFLTEKQTDVCDEWQTIQ